MFWLGKRVLSMLPTFPKAGSLLRAVFRVFYSLRQLILMNGLCVLNAAETGYCSERDWVSCLSVLFLWPTPWAWLGSRHQAVCITDLSPQFPDVPGKVSPS